MATPSAPGAVEAVELLERAVGYTRGSLQLVSAPLLARPTPCAGWDLRCLLRHMDDSLAAFTEAAAVGYVDLAPVPADPAQLLVSRIRARACALLGVWVPGPVTGTASVGDRWLPMQVLGVAGALEITVHGWDVARACGVDRPVPEALAAELLGVLPELVSDVDRPHRFAGPVDVPDSAPAADRLLARLGRRP